MITCIDMEDPSANVRFGCLVKIADTIGTYGQPDYESLGYCQKCGAKVITYQNDQGNTVRVTYKDGEMRRDII